MVLRTHKTDVNGGLTMEENLYKKLKSVGASNLVFGIDNTLWYRSRCNDDY